MTFKKWFTKLKLTRTAYLTSELKPIFEDCWWDGFGTGLFCGFVVGSLLVLLLG